MPIRAFCAAKSMVSESLAVPRGSAQAPSNAADAAVDGRVPGSSI